MEQATYNIATPLIQQITDTENLLVQIEAAATNNATLQSMTVTAPGIGGINLTIPPDLLLTVAETQTLAQPLATILQARLTTYQTALAAL